MKIEISDGLNINYEVYGQGPRLLLLHGWGVDLHSFDLIIPHLSPYFQIFLLDLPGFGSSSKLPHIFGTKDYASAVEEFLKILGIGDFNLLGHSFGGAISLVLTAQNKAVNKLILVDSAGIRIKSSYTKLKIFLYKILKKAVPKSKETLIQKVLGSADYRNAGELRGTFIKIVNEDLRHLLPQIKTPALIAWGENDTVTTLKEARILQQGIAGSQLKIIEHSGHLPQIDSPEPLSQLIVDFLNSGKE